jgi:hypothetical protein
MAGARAEAGRALRKVVPRSSHAVWDPAGRPSPLRLLEESNRHRVPELVPIRIARMRASPFAFLRGAPGLMAHDLATTPVTGITVQACGDAHLLNFGLFATPEATTSVLEPYVGRSRYRHPGRRVVSGQRLLQTASDIFLGWAGDGTSHYHVRQLWDMKGSVDLDTLDPADLVPYARLCGWVLARAHARSGDGAAISGYLGSGDRFDRAVADFAEAYADQTEVDHAAFSRWLDGFPPRDGGRGGGTNRTDQWGGDGG